MFSTLCIGSVNAAVHGFVANTIFFSAYSLLHWNTDVRGLKISLTTLLPR